MAEKLKLVGPKAGRWLILIGSMVLLVAGLKAAQDFFLPILLAFFVATVSLPITNLVARKLPRSLAVLITVLVDFSFIVGLLLLAFTLVDDLQTKWNHRYAAEVSNRIQTESVSLAKTLEKWGVEDARAKINEAVQDNLKDLQNIRFGQIWDVGTGLLGRVVGFFGTFLIVLVLTIFMLLEAAMFGRRFDLVSQARGPNLSRLLSATKDIQRYLAIKTVISLVTGFLAGFLCWAADLDFYILWGILAYALNYIPVIGSLVAGVPPTILALITSGAPSAVIVAGGYLLINNVLGGFVEPMLVGRRFGISTLVIVIAVMFWGWVWGPLGMLMAVPITMMLKVVLEGSNEFRWISVAISADHTPEAIHQALLESVPQADPETEEPAGQTTAG
ncbi:MAG: AI-2E family transporter [Akkermansiaceae bacterium]|nr:AI-2E family transporter [Akkermansiaceae bacterium]MCF7732794.1 AI-2E family transporter [Akkermansiaceae bacterium]